MFFISKLQKYFSFSACSKTLLESTCQHLLFLVGFDTLTYRKDYNRSPILVGHQDSFLAPLTGSEALLVSGIGKERFYCRYCFYLCLLLCFSIEHSSLSMLSGSDSTTTPMVEKSPPLSEVDPFEMLIIDIDKHWQSWRGQIFLCSFSAIPGNGARKLLVACWQSWVVPQAKAWM